MQSFVCGFVSPEQVCLGCMQPSMLCSCLRAKQCPGLFLLRVSYDSSCRPTRTTTATRLICGSFRQHSWCTRTTSLPCTWFVLMSFSVPCVAGSWRRQHPTSRHCAQKAPLALLHSCFSLQLLLPSSPHPLPVREHPPTLVDPLLHVVPGVQYGHRVLAHRSRVCDRLI
jgi:hypothetical protein